MVFTHDTEVSLQAAVALVNSAEEPETMTTLAELDAWFAENQYTGSRTHDTAELESVRALRPLLRRLLSSDLETTVELVNRVLAERDAVPELVQHDDFGWHLHAVDRSAPLADRIAVETAMALADVVRVDDLSRLALCADDECEGLVLDLSRNRSRRYCSTTCGNRNAVAAYRARRRDD